MKKDEILRKVISKWVMKRRERYIVLEGIKAEIHKIYIYIYIYQFHINFIYDMIDLLRL
jgi:hypothetical protein